MDNIRCARHGIVRNFAKDFEVSANTDSVAHSSAQRKFTEQGVNGRNRGIGKGGGGDSPRYSPVSSAYSTISQCLSLLLIWRACSVVQC